MNAKPLYDLPGSTMPLDATPHWDWQNPLNLLAMLPMLALVLGMIGALL